MIIFGSRTMPSTRDQGDFHCPRCSTQKPYRLISMNRWFTLYFIPVIPMGSAGEYIECTACAGTYDTQVLSYDPEAERRETMATIRRALSLFLLTVGRTAPEDIERLQSAWHEMLGETLDTRLIEQDIRQARDARIALPQFVAQQLTDINVQGKAAVLRAATLSVSIGGYLQPADEGPLKQLGAALGLRPADVDGIIAQG